MHRHTLLAALGLVGLATLPAAAQTVPGYTFIELGSLRGQNSRITGINAAGQICGTGYFETSASGKSNSRAFRIDPLDTDNDGVPDTWFVPDENGFNSLMLLFSLPDPYKWSNALGINADGAIAGQMAYDGGATPQNTLYGAPDGTGVRVSSDSSYGRGINDSGTVVGGAIYPKSGKTPGGEFATIWRLFNGIFTATNLGIEVNSQGTGINNWGQVTGTDANNVAYLWLPSPAYELPAGKTSLGTFGGTTSNGWAINDSGHVVGGASDAGGNSRAFLWAPPTDSRFVTTPGLLTDLMAGSDWLNTFAYALNNPASGAPLLVAGYGFNAQNQQRAVLWDSARRQMRDLNTLVVNPPQRAMWEARGVNAQGWIVGSYHPNAETNSRGFLLIPNATLPDASVVPAGVTGLGGSASGTLASLSWTDGTGEHGLKIDRSTDGTKWTQIASLPADATGYADSAVVQGMTYTYRVTPFNVAGYAPATQTSVAIGAPLAPTIGTASALSATSVRVRWTNNSNGQSAVFVERSTSASFTSVVTTTASGTATQLDVTGLTGNTTYYFRVRSQNSVGYSAYSGTSTATTPRR